MAQVYDIKLYTTIGTTKDCEILYLHVLVQFQNKQERPLGQRKTPPANKLPYVAARYMSKTTGKYISSTTQYQNDLEFDLSRSLKVKCDDGVIEHPIYAFILMLNSNIGPN